MSSIGNKIKGAAQVVHGMGENIRGTGLGAVDTVAHEGENKGDTIAHSGREEKSRGMANMGRAAPAANESYTDTRTPTVSGNTNQVDGTGVHPRGYDGAVGTENHSKSSGGMPSGTHTHPSHHRDDAISNEPDAMNVGRQHEFQEYQSHPDLGAYNQSHDRSTGE